MQWSNVRRSSPHRRQRARVALVGLGLLASVGGCDAGGTELDGRYTVSWTADELTLQVLQVLGDPDDPQDQQAAADLGKGNAGTLELSLSGGRYDLFYVDMDDSCPGTYVLDGDRIVMTATMDPSEWDCGGGLGEIAADAAWSLNGGVLTFTDWRVPNPRSMLGFNSVLLGLKAWERTDH
jgi:hypothetical protein